MITLLYIVVALVVSAVLAGAFANSWSRWFAAFFGSLFATVPAALLVGAIIYVPPGHVGVAILLGEVRGTTYEEGVSLTHPFASSVTMSVRRESVDFTAKGGDDVEVVALSADSNALQVDVSFPWQLNPRAAAELFRRVGDLDKVEKAVLTAAARSTVRDVIARFTWTDASIDKRDQVATAMRDDIERAVVDDLLRQRVPEEIARTAIAFGPVLLRKMLPDPKILNSISERMASEEDLKRQRVLSDIARAEAERRKNEGAGVAKLFAELPKGFDAADIALILNALADKARADATAKAVEGGKVQLIVVPGGSPVSIPVR